MRAAMIAIGVLSLATLGLAAHAAELDVSVGKALFDRQWIQAPASTDGADGLGPLFNAKACNSCHKDGGPARIIILDGELIPRGMVVRTGSATGEADPYYGHQLQDRAVSGLVPEAKISAQLIKAAAKNSRLMPDFSVGFSLTGPGLDPGTLTELRLAPSLAGRGLIERVAPEAILAHEDPDDRDGDGISGRARRLTSAGGETVIGRFGLKATAASLAEQTANAAALDIGLSSPAMRLPYGDCTQAEQACLKLANGRSSDFEGEEVSEDIIDMIAAYVASLPRKPVPASPQAQALFASAGCAACHVPQMPDAQGQPLDVFSDLLLHDMGPALSGKIGDQFASPQEWRTAPLIDLDPLKGKRRYLHDGRAASIDAAIRWHGGEAFHAQHAYEALSQSDRDALVHYLEAL